MKVILFVLFAAALAGELKAETSLEDTTITTPTEPSTSDETTATLKPTTTLVTTTSNPPTSTEPPTSSSTSSSTAASSTSEAPVPTSSPATPTPTPEPEKNCPFNVTDGKATCIRAELQADFMINVEGKKYPVKLGCNASFSGSDCSSSNDTETLILSESIYTLTMVFEKVSSKVLVKNITFSYDLPQGPKGTVSSSSEDLFNVMLGHSYLCKSNFDVHLDNVTMSIHEIKIQAFLESDKTYGPIEECDADEKVSDIVPIAVGVALAALIIIVLIAYLVGRRRSRQRGYQSV